VKDVNDLARILHEAFDVARSGRPGPVVVDIPKDVQFAEGLYIEKDEAPSKRYRPQTEPDPALITAAVDLMAKGKKPLFYIGGGVINAGPQASEALTRFIRMTGFPCVQTLMGLGAFPASDPLSLGMVGMHGMYESNMAMHACDVMINIGARFDDRVTGRLDAFAPNSKKIHVDIDPSSINKNVAVDIGIVGDAGRVIEAMLARWKEIKAKPDGKAIAGWWELVEGWRKRNCLAYKPDPKVIKPQYALERLRAKTAGRDDVYITTEVGQHQMWAAQYLRFEKPNHWMTSGGLGTMGYGLPAAIGVQVAHPGAIVIDVAGEASTLMNIQEMSTAAQYQLPVKVFVLNNEWMGMVRQWQELLHGARYSESYSASLPDFVKLAEAFGWTGLRVTDPADVDATIDRMLSTPGPVFVDCCIAKTENCYPMIPSGAAHNEMLLGPADEAAHSMSEEGMVLV
jgi:acetolactate synthase-1/2/3 large subunit